MELLLIFTRWFYYNNKWTWVKIKKRLYIDTTSFLFILK